MNCSEAEHFFDAYLDGELAGSLRLEFDAHRLRCTVCQQKLAMMEACEHILARDTRGPALSENFTDRVMGEIDQQRVIARRVRKRRIIVGAAVAFQAAAVIVFAVLWVGYWSQPAQPVLEPGADPEFTEAVGDAMDRGDPVRLWELVHGKYQDGLAAISNLSDEPVALAGYVPAFLNLDELTGVSDDSPGLLDALMGFLAPRPAEEVEPESDAAGSYSL